MIPQIEITEEQIQKSVSAAFDSVNLNPNGYSTFNWIFFTISLLTDIKDKVFVEGDYFCLLDNSNISSIIKNSELIVITSNYGKYNTINYDTIFSKNVKIDYVDNIITGDYLDFSMLDNLLIISRNVVYKNLENTMKADVLEFDIKTKNTKIYMYDSKKKVNIKNLD